jgi:genome maintenance exonuclease 1
LKQFIHVPFESQVDLIAEETEFGRQYKVPSGELYPSVTTVTGYEKRQFFAEWRKNNPERAERAVKRGTNFHKMIEDHINNLTVDVKKYSYYESMLFQQILPEVNKIDNVRCQEMPLWSSALKLAGRVDCIAEYKGKLSVIDFKTASREKFYSDIKEYFMQATAYAIMCKERTGITINNIAILMSCEDGSVNVFEENPTDHVKNLYEAIKKYEREMLSSR